MAAAERSNLHRALGAMRPPEKITQEAFEGSDRHLRRLARLRPGELADAKDLWQYVSHDVRYTTVDASLFRYLLPFCLYAWRDDLRGITRDYGVVVEHLYVALADQTLFQTVLTDKQQRVVSQFMQQTILEEIDDQRGLAFEGSETRAYRWFGALTTYGVLRPDLDRLWAAWWSVSSTGRAIAAVQYISCLMYGEYENPVFAPWTPDRGGGPPTLWEFEGHLYEHRWLQPNVDFLKEFLTAAKVTEVLARAVLRLSGEPEHEAATMVRDHLPLCIETLETRCIELPVLLGTTQQPGSVVDFEWSR